MNNLVIIVAIIAILLGSLIGFTIGSYVTLKAVGKVASSFMDEDLIKKAIYQYKEQIGACYQPLNS